MSWGVQTAPDVVWSEMARFWAHTGQLSGVRVDRAALMDEGAFRDLGWRVSHGSPMPADPQAGPDAEWVRWWWPVEGGDISETDGLGPLDSWGAVSW